LYLEIVGKPVQTSFMIIRPGVRLRNAARCAALVAVLGVAAARGPTSVAHAQSLIHELKIGALHHDTPHLWSGFQREPDAVDLNVEVQFSPALHFLRGTIRPAIGGTANFSGETSKAYADLRWQYETTTGIFFGLGLGVAVHDGALGVTHADRKALGARALFHIPFEVGVRLDRYNSISLYFEHISNGYTRRYNEGMDGIGLRYGYRF
jgi:hypothetical protein